MVVLLLRVVAGAAVAFSAVLLCVVVMVATASPPQARELLTVEEANGAIAAARQQIDRLWELRSASDNPEIRRQLLDQYRKLGLAAPFLDGSSGPPETSRAGWRSPRRSQRTSRRI
jgi:hypothetical protein